MYSFSAEVGSRGYHVYRNTSWLNSLFFNFLILRTVALKASRNDGRPKFCLDVIRAGVKEAGVELGLA